MQLTQDQIRGFEDEGYLFLPNQFTRAEVGVLKRELPGIFAQDRKENVREKDGKTVRTTFAAHTFNEAYRRLGRHPRMIEPVMQLVGGPVYMHQYKINAKAAFDGDVWQWHQDYGTWARDDLMPTTRAMTSQRIPPIQGVSVESLESVVESQGLILKRRLALSARMIIRRGIAV